MEKFKIFVGDKVYTVQRHPQIHKLFDVFNENTYHRIGFNDANEWVYIEYRQLSEPIDLERVGEAIESYLRDN